jgi:hypothetical protein
MFDSFFFAGRWMEKFKFFILLILSLSVLLICHCGGGGGGGGSHGCGESSGGGATSGSGGSSGGGATSGSGGSSGGGETSGTLNLAWEASSDSAVVGHFVYYGTRSGTYEPSVDAGSTPGPGNTITYTLRGLSRGQTYYIVVTAYDRYRNESDFSNEVSGLAK